MPNNIINFPSPDTFLQFFFDKECFEDDCHFPFRMRIVCPSMEDGIYLSYANVLELMQQLITALKDMEMTNE